MFKILLSLFCLFIYNNIVFAITGEELVKKMEEITKPQDMKSDMELTLINKKGKQKTMKFRSFIKDQGKKQIMWFLSPVSDKGISFLKIEKENKQNKMYMWLPAFKKIRRITSKKNSDAFMGSDMSYEDLYNRTENEYTFLIVKEDSLNGNLCYILETTPKPVLKSSYSKHQSWIIKDSYVPMKELSYDKKGNLLKEKYYKFSNIGNHKITKSIEVKNIQKNHTTQLRFNNIQINTGLNDDQFHERHLKRIPQFEK